MNKNDAMIMKLVIAVFAGYFHIAGNSDLMERIVGFRIEISGTFRTIFNFGCSVI